MRSIETAIALLTSTPTCALLPAAGIPLLERALELPGDLKAFYSVAGGAELFEGSDYQFTILAPSEVISTNLRLLGTAVAGDVSDHWFTIATDGNGDYLSIDLSASHLGRCYDSFHE